MAWSTADLITRVRRKARIPDGSFALSDAELLSIADEVTRVHIMGMLRRTSGEWYVAKYTTPIVVGQSAYRLPSRVQAGGVRLVTIQTANGSEYALPESRPEIAHTSSSSEGWSNKFHLLEDNSVVIFPTPTAAGDLVCIRYRRQPSDLIVAADPRGVLLTSGTAQTATTASTIASPFTSTLEADVVQARPPFDLLVASGSGSGSGTSFVFTDTAVSVADVASGDYLCVAGLSPVPQVPPVCHDMLVYGTALIVADELGTERRADSLRRSFAAVSEDVFEQLTDRNEGASQKVVPRYTDLRGGFLGRRGL